MALRFGSHRKKVSKNKTNSANYAFPLVNCSQRYI